ncbi:MAG: hypothetical protein R3C16_01095 [Hyphomonadaceae bacterium]
MFGNKDKSKNGGGDFSGLSALFLNCTLKRSPEIASPTATPPS